MSTYELTRNWMSINMTDEEFIERLRHCIEEGMCHTCQYFNFNGEAPECSINRMLVSAYDLIIKQNAEIESIKQKGE